MKKRNFLIHGGILSAIFLIGFGPLLIALVAEAFAGFNGCYLSEGFESPCVVWGFDFSEPLYAMGLMAWFSIPGLVIAFLLLGIFLAVLFVLWLRKRAKSEETN